MYAQASEPAWEPFAERFGRYFQREPFEVAALAGEDVARMLSRMRGSTSRGADGWSVGELKRLPVPLLDDLASLFRAIETTGVWPSALQEGLVSLISKGEGARPCDLRPITVMSAVYRLWALCRLQDLMLWQER